MSTKYKDKQVSTNFKIKGVNKYEDKGCQQILNLNISTIIKIKGVNKYQDKGCQQILW